MPTTPTLTVYKASAGSGKTFTLAIEYIKLLIQNPMSYRNILAVTFTNKATGEMKSRILSQLYGIWKQLPKSDDYMKRVINDLGVTKEYASDRARLALHFIIYNYSYFRIQTIDTFFQSVLRNLARELDLTANLRIEINDEGVESQAVDELLYNLKDNDIVLSWILSFMKEKIDDEKDWNIIGDLKRFGKNIFKEVYKCHNEQLNAVLSKEEFFHGFQTLLNANIAKAEKEMHDIGQGFMEILEKHGYTVDDFFYKEKGVCGYFVKLAKGIFDESVLSAKVVTALNENGPDIWVKKEKTKKGKEKQQALTDLVNEQLNDYLIEAEKKRETAYFNYASSKCTLTNLNQLRLLHSIDRKVREMNAEANRFLLSDTQSLLNALIDGSDSPFIFEKIGTQLDNIMIDEFQDTSTVQWKNFKILLEECMSRGNTGNLIVGDVKQSIYRWRDGDWRLLNNIESHFTDAKNRLKFCPLSTNYRSTRRVVNFNNAFFTKAASIESEHLLSNNIPSAKQLEQAYKKKEVEQNVPDDKPDAGYVRVTLLDQRDELEELRHTIENLLKANVPQQKIAILIRKNDHIPVIAQYLAETMPEVKLVSNEAFRLDSSLAVNVIVTAMYYLTHPDDELTKAYLAKAYHKYICKKGTSDNDIFIDQEEEQWLPKKFTNKREQLLTMPIYDLAEELYGIFELNLIEGQTAYLCEFYDQLLTFLSDNSADIDEFVEEWNATIHKSTISASDIDGIRIISIHQSKGLEYEYVIIPYCNWLLSREETFWCTPNEAPYNALPVIPITSTAKQLRATIYESESMEETLQNTVDNLNLLYVAFTRAEKELYVIAKPTKANFRAHLIEEVMPEVAKALGENNVLISENDEAIVYEYGEATPYLKKKNEEADQNVFIPQTSKIEVSIIEHSDSHTDFRQSNQSREFINSDENIEQTQYLKMGNLLHKLFSNIKTIDDADGAITQMEQDGLLSESTITSQKLRKMLEKRWQTPQVRDWFSDRWETFNECTILSFKEGCNEIEEHRPDRVMTDGKEIIVVDFKFGSPKPSYELQVREYMQLIRNMGHNNVRGYLWFVYSNKIEEVI